MNCDESDLINHDWIPDTGGERFRCRNCGKEVERKGWRNITRVITQARKGMVKIEDVRIFMRKAGRKIRDGALVIPTIEQYLYQLKSKQTQDLELKE